MILPLQDTDGSWYILKYWQASGTKKAAWYLQKFKGQPRLQARLIDKVHLPHEIIQSRLGEVDALSMSRNQYRQQEKWRKRIYSKEQNKTPEIDPNEMEMNDSSNRVENNSHKDIYWGHEQSKNIKVGI